MNNYFCFWCLRLNGFYNFIENNQKNLLKQLKIHPDYFNVTSFLHVMSEYVGDGLYSFLFEVSEDQTYKIEDKRLIVFELDEVKDNKEILSVMLKLCPPPCVLFLWILEVSSFVLYKNVFFISKQHRNSCDPVLQVRQSLRVPTHCIPPTCTCV